MRAPSVVPTLLVCLLEPCLALAQATPGRAPATEPAAATPATETRPAETAQPPASAPTSDAAVPVAGPPAVEAAVSDTTPSAAPAESELQKRIKAAAESADALIKDVWRLKGKSTIAPAQARGLETQINAWKKMLGTLGEEAVRLQLAEQPGSAVPPGHVAGSAIVLESGVKNAEDGLSGVALQLKEAESATGWNLVGTILRARCATAICFDNGAKKDWLGIEPLVELPVGKSLALSRSSLSNYVDNHDLRIDLAAGVRVWLFRDIVSVSVYISKPLTDGRIRLQGSPFVYPAASIRRPYPGLGLGLFFDSLWLGFDRDELRNGDGQDATALNTDFPPNSVVSSTWTLTVALQPVTAFRTAIGTAVQSSATQSSNGAVR